MNKNTTIIKMYIQNRASLLEIAQFKQTIAQREIKLLSMGGTEKWSAFVQEHKEVVDHINDGNKLQAVKILKDRTGLGLKEAKDVVDEYCEFIKTTQTNGYLALI